MAGDSGPEEKEEGAPRVKAPCQPTENREMFPVIESVGVWIELLSPPLSLSLFRGSIDGLIWVYQIVEGLFSIFLKIFKLKSFPWVSSLGELNFAYFCP